MLVALRDSGKQITKAYIHNLCHYTYKYYHSTSTRLKCIMRLVYCGVRVCINYN